MSPWIAAGFATCGVDRLEPAPRDGNGERPPGIKRWVNPADKGDLIAIPPSGVSARFRGVDRDVIRGELIMAVADGRK